MPRTSPFLKPMRKMGSTPRISTRARLVRISYNPDYRAPIEPLAGLNRWESEVFRALVDLKINFQTQTAFGGGNVAGGSRADFVLPDYALVILVNGPWHDTTYGRARDILAELNYQVAGYRIERVFGDDFIRLKPRLLELIGIPVGGR